MNTIEISIANIKKLASEARKESMQVMKESMRGEKGFAKYAEVALYYAKDGFRVDAISYGFPSIKAIKEAIKNYPDYDLFIEGSIEWYLDMEAVKYRDFLNTEYWQVPITL